MSIKVDEQSMVKSAGEKDLAMVETTEREFSCKTKGPDFLIIGTKKSATSAIYSYINEHPQVIPCVRKEMHFFSTHYSKGIEWYLSHFYPIRENIRTGKSYLTGEASPGYLGNEQAARRILNHFPNVKLIVSLRNPIDRAVSDYYHRAKTAKNENCSLEEALDINDFTHSGKYLNRGKYIHGIKSWMEVFPNKQQWLIIRYEDLISEPIKLRKKVFSFLNIPDKTNIDFTQKVYANKYDYPKITVEKRMELNEYFHESNQQLEKFLNMSFDWK
ncbi:glycosyltransferase involved in LPS biosynthesis [Xenococcus sp. PCC 7305]|uniref:sulfotransferase domain-containing protein n=1 Tax=Xenococcus sp. PCC 7305 TaxID=102125 RepID=UPI0002ABA7B7|nr:sulfotransferase domain-containing protein [Xenococcus sp. PCC 7305]ELS01299.1 glycosyltransferase involved in LPS biosynthesis [Xenococcus sp. PCC 7305]